MFTNDQTADPRTTLQELRTQAGISARELSILARVAPNTIRNAERGVVPHWRIQEAIVSALRTALQNEAERIQQEAAERIRRENERLEAIKRDAELARAELLWPVEAAA